MTFVFWYQEFEHADLFPVINSVCLPMFTTQQLIGLTFIPASLIGVCNWLVVVATWRSRSLSHSFSLLTTNQAVFNGIHSIVCLFYVSPMIILHFELLITYSNHCGFIMILCFDAAVHAHFLLALNRFCAVYTPIMYKKSFSLEYTRIIITLSFLISFTTSFLIFYILPCAMTYSIERWGFLYPTSPVCHILDLFVNIGKLITLSAIDLILDVSTMWKVKRIRNLSGNMSKKEVGFIKQSLSQSIHVFCLMIAFCFVPMITTDKVIHFFVSDVDWCLLNSLIGFFTLVFNSEIRNSLFADSRVSTSEASGNSLDAKTIAAKI